MALLNANANLNGFDVIERHEVALSDQSGTASFVVFDNASGLASFAPGLDGGKVIEVTTTTLDDLAARLNAPVAVLKLDIEGAEVKALRGARSMLGRDLPLVLLEVEPGTSWADRAQASKTCVRHCTRSDTRHMPSVAMLVWSRSRDHGSPPQRRPRILCLLQLRERTESKA